MKPLVRNILIGVIIVLIIVFIGGFNWWNKTKVAALPQTDGTLNVPGLDGPVEVIRDNFGIPHIYATTEHDLMFAQGYVEAQDRFWQMDFNRHTSAGRLSELLGEATYGTDSFLRTLGWERTAKQELDLIDDVTLEYLQFYSDGVNAYIGGRDKSELALEYTFLDLVNSDYEVEPWTPLHSLTWPKAMAWDLRGNLGEEINRALMLATLSEEQVSSLYPPYPESAPVIVNDIIHINFTAEFQNTNSNLAQQMQPAMQQIAQQFALADDVFGGAPDDSVGSNSWVINGELSDTGMPILANDPHLGHSIPHIWYEIGLHCMPKTPDCNLDVTGFSFAGTPLAVIGHNDKISWAFTNTGPDVIDLFVEKINPNNPYQYEFMGEWLDMEVLTETINIGGGDPVDLEVRITQHGPIITDVYGLLEDFDENSGIDLPENYAIAMAWTALDPGTTLQAVFKLNYAQNFEEFRDAARDFIVPAQNLLYADVEGNIGYQMPGHIPIRANNSDGLYPVPGWTGEHEWEGYIPFDELPYTFNPPEGYIVTANNAVVGADYPYHIADTWAYGLRAQSLIDLIEQAIDQGPISVADMQQMQAENRNINAEFMVPLLLELEMPTTGTAKLQAYLADWDYQNDVDSLGAAIFEAFWIHLVDQTFYDEVPEEVRLAGASRLQHLMTIITQDPNHFWWDNADTPEQETMDVVFIDAMAAAQADLEIRFGNDETQWRWGRMHTFTLEHAVMSNFPIAPSVFNRGPYPVGGGSSIVNASNWKVANGDWHVDGTSVSFRMVVDLSDLNNSWVIHPTGQSGHPFSKNYIDMFPLWQNYEYTQMWFDYDGLKAISDNILNLEP